MTSIGKAALQPAYCLLLMSSWVFLVLADCIPQQSPPVKIAVRNVTLPGQLVGRGAAVSVGSPPQALAFELNTFLNDTFLFDPSSPCLYGSISNTPTQCSVQHGGFFDEGRSTTWEQAPIQVALGAARSVDGNLAKDLWGRDTIVLDSSLSQAGHPFGVVRESPNLENTLGLGSNSSLLNALRDKGAILSKTWGLAWGWTGADAAHQTEGSLVLGGYDEARISGPNVTFPFDESIGYLSVTITDMTLNFQNGTDAGFLPDSRKSGIPAIVSPNTALLNLPDDVFENFLLVSNYQGPEPNRSTGVNWWGMTFFSSDVYTGDLTITLSTGVKVRIPNHQLVLPDYHINSEGSQYIRNGTTSELLINSLADTNENDSPQLGRVFLTSAYVFVDHDKHQFTVASANNSNLEEKLVAVGTSICNSSASPTAPSGGDSSPSPSPSSESVAPGGIAGIVIGACAVLAAIAALFFWRRRRTQGSRQQHLPNQDQTLAPMATETTNVDEQNDRVTSYISLKPEMPTDSQPPQEMPVQRHQPYSLAPYEMG